jgi:hypothetical protein
MPQQSLVPSLPPEEPPPPTTTPLLQRISKEIRDATPADRDAIVQRAQPYIQQEQARLSQAHEIWKEKQTLRRQLELEQYKLRASEPKTAADITHVQQQTATGNIIEMPDGNKYRQDPVTGRLKPIEIEGVSADQAPPLPKNEFQLKSLKHAEQMHEAEKIIDEGKALRSGASATGSQMPIVGGYLQTDAYRKERTAAERWVINKIGNERRCLYIAVPRRACSVD